MAHYVQTREKYKPAQTSLGWGEVRVQAQAGDAGEWRALRARWL